VGRALRPRHKRSVRPARRDHQPHRGTLNLELVRAEAGRTTEHPEALDYILRGRAAQAKPQSRDRFAEQISLYERALALDPHSVEAQSFLAIAHTGRVMSGMADSPAADIGRAEELIAHALAVSPQSMFAHYAKGQVLRAQRRFAEAIPEYEMVLASNRNWVRALAALGNCKLFAGSIEETIPLVQQAIRLSPRDPDLALWYQQIGFVHLLQSRTDEAITWLEPRFTILECAPFNGYVPLSRPRAHGPHSAGDAGAATTGDYRAGHPRSALPR
jgi:tetratricopeptide (TPR) repeat protein